MIKPNANKEQSQAVRAIRLCRAQDQPGYCCLDPVSGRIYVSPHVRFVEDEAPGLTTVSPGLRESRTQEGTHRFYRFRTPLRVFFFVFFSAFFS